MPLNITYSIYNFFRKKNQCIEFPKIRSLIKTAFLSLPRMEKCESKGQLHSLVLAPRCRLPNVFRFVAGLACRSAVNYTHTHFYATQPYINYIAKPLC